MDTNQFDISIMNIITDAKKECGWDIDKGHRFFCGPMASTDFKKSSSGGIQGARFQNLRELLGDFTDVHEIALRLRKINWE